MTEAHRRKEPTDSIPKEEVAWAAAHLPELQRGITRRRFVRDALVIAFVVGLAAHIGGYLLLSAVTGEPFRLLADLLATLGTALWTGVVLYVFVNVLPAARQRAAARWLEAYEARIRGQSPLGVDTGRPTTKHPGTTQQPTSQRLTPLSDRGLDHQ